MTLNVTDSENKWNVESKTTSVFKLPTPPVGGEWFPTDKLQLSVPYLVSALLTLVIAASFVFVKRVRKRQN